MPRFKLNRWWILILTLSLVCTLAASQSTYAAPTLLRRIGDGGSGGGPPPDGDPDTPMGRWKRAQSGGARPTVASTRRVAGDGMPVDSVMMWHFRVVMQSLGLLPFGRF